MDEERTSTTGSTDSPPTSCPDGQRLETICSALPDYYFIFDESGRYLDSFAPREPFLRPEHNGYCGKRVEDVFPPETTEQILQTLRQTVQTGQPQRLEHVMDVNGVKYWFEGRTSPIIADGQAPRVLWISRNITEQKRSRNRLEFLASVLDQIVDQITVTDLQGRITYVNQSQLNVLKIPREDIIGNKTEIFGEDPTLGATQQEILEATLEHGHWEGQVINYDSEGKRHILHCRTWMVRDENDQPTALCGTATDITKQVEVEDALHIRETELRAIADYAYDWEEWIDPDGRLKWSNFAAERITGYTWQERLAMEDYPQPLIHPNDHELMREVYAEAYQERSSGDGLVFRVLRKDGQIIWAEASWQPFYDENNEFLGVRYSIRDISRRVQAEHDRVRLESRLLQAQKEESLCSLAGGIAHDFNNLLTAISGNADLGLRFAKDETLREFFQEIRNASERAGKLSNQMRAYSGRGHAVIEPILIEKEIHEMEPLLQATVSRRIELRLKLADPPRAILADASQMRQLLLSLVANASEAIGDGDGVILIHTGTFLSNDSWHQSNTSQNSKIFASGECFLLEVSDTGCGMDSESIPKLFDPFYTTKDFGRGLGLPAVQGIVRGHGGAISVESELGLGSTFRILLPYA